MTTEVKTILTAEDLTAEAFRHMGENAKQAVEKINGAFDSMKTAMEAAFVGVSVAGASEFVQRMTEAGDRLEKLAIRAGVGGQQMAQFAYIARLADVDISELANGISKMQRNLIEAADGSDKARAAFGSVGLTISELRRLSPDQQFEAIATAIKNIEDPARQAAAAQQIFGRGAASLLPIFKEGGQAIRDLADEYKGFTGALDDEAVAQLAKAEDGFKKLKAAGEALAQTLIAKLGPSLAATFDALRSHLSDSESLKLQVQIAQLQNALVNSVSDPLVTKQRLDQIAELQLRLNDLTAARDVQRFDADVQSKDASKGGGSVTVVGRDWDTWLNDVMPEFDTKAIAAQRIQQSALDKFYADIDKSTETTNEKILGAMVSLETNLKQALDNGDITPEEYSKRWLDAMDKLLPPIQVHAKMIRKEFKTFSDDAIAYGKQASDALTQGFASFFDGTTTSLGGLVKNFAKAFDHILAEASARKLMGILFSGSGGGDAFFAGIFSALGLGGTQPSPGGSATGATEDAIFGGMFASGGDPPVGRVSLVGETGPELFVPKTAGTIVPNGKFGGITINQAHTFNIDSRSDRSQIASDVMTLIRSSNKEMMQTLLRYNPGLRA